MPKNGAKKLSRPAKPLIIFSHYPDKDLSSDGVGSDFFAQHFL
jgi:hypothetical protein